LVKSDENNRCLHVELFIRLWVNLESTSYVTRQMCNVDKCPPPKKKVICENNLNNLYFEVFFCTSGGFISFRVTEEKEAPRIITLVIHFTTTIHKEKSNKMQQCIKILLYHIYMKLNMFRPTHRPSSGA
jgi:hypothetical protein